MTKRPLIPLVAFTALLITGCAERLVDFHVIDDASGKVPDSGFFTQTRGTRLHGGSMFVSGSMPPRDGFVSDVTVRNFDWFRFDIEGYAPGWVYVFDDHVKVWSGGFERPVISNEFVFGERKLNIPVRLVRPVPENQPKAAKAN